MTLRQVLAVIWQRKILVAVTLVLVMLAAYGYLRTQVSVYESSVTLKFSVAATEGSTSSGIYQGTPFDPDTDTITTEAVLRPAAEALGESSWTTLSEPVITQVLNEGNRTNRVTITAQGGDPQQAKARADAVANAFSDLLKQQIATGVKTLETQRNKASDDVQTYQKQINASDGNNSLAQQLQNTALAQLGALTSQLTSIAAAGAPTSVAAPSRLGTLTSASPLTVLGVGFLSGLIAGMGAALIRDQFDDRLLSAEDVEEAIGEPVLGELAVDKGRKKNDLSVPTERRTNTAFNEGIRTLRTSLQVLAPQRHSMVVVTSPEPGEGKTFVTASLAVSLARAGRQVIIVSGDLRRPRLTRYFGVADSPGLADAIVGEVDKETLRGMLQPASQPGLMVLPHGSRDVDPADLLATQAVGPVLTRLRQLADVVIIDSPPALALADAANLATHADGVLVISALHRTKRVTLTGTLRNLRANGVNVFGVVCNRSTDAVPKSYETTYLLDESDKLPETDDVLDLDLDADANPGPTNHAGGADLETAERPSVGGPDGATNGTAHETINGTAHETINGASNGTTNGATNGAANGAANGHASSRGDEELTTVVRRTGRRLSEDS